MGWDRIPDWGSVFHSDVGVFLWGMKFAYFKANYMQIGGAMRRLRRRFLMWLVWNVPLGRLAPWVLGLATRRKPRKEGE